MSNEAVFPTPEAPFVGVTPPDTIQALLARLREADAIAPALVRWGLLAELPDERERVYLLGVGDYERVAVSGGHRIRQERFAVRGLVEVHALGVNGPEEPAARSWQLLEGIDASLSQDPDLGPSRYAQNLSVVADEALPMTDGWLARLLFRLTFFHNR